MSFNADWDIEKYREEYESDEHWELRKKFMLTHKNKFPEDRLVCLAQVFFNVEFLGCRYPDKTMQLVAELSKGVADDHREKQKGKLKRTFVQASDAAGAKVKGISPACSTDPTLNSPESSTDLTQSSYLEKRIKTDTQLKAFINFCPAQDTCQNKSDLPKTFTPINFIKEKPEKRTIKKGTGPFADIVIFSASNQNPLSTIHRTCGVNKVKYSVQTTTLEDGKLKYEILLNDEVLAAAVGNSPKKELAASAAELGLEKLTASCYTIEQKHRFISGGEVVTKDAEAQNKQALDPADSIGAKIMRLMGWSGNEGLGKNNQGIEKPIEAQQTISRAGLGHSRGNVLLKKFAQIFKEYALGDSEYDLVFSTEFTSEERASLHMLAKRYKLKTKSIGKGDERHLIVSKARADVWKIVEELLATENCETEKYRLIEPSFSNSAVIIKHINVNSSRTIRTEDSILIPKRPSPIPTRFSEETKETVAELPCGRDDESRGTESRNVISDVKELDAGDAELKEVKSFKCSLDLTWPDKLDKPNTLSSAASNNLCPDQGRVSDVDFIKEKSEKLNVKKGTGRFADIVILNTYENKNPGVTLAQTCKVNGAKFFIDTFQMSEGNVKSEVRINGHLLSTAYEKSRRASKFSAMKLGLETLSASCYTVQEKFKVCSKPVFITSDTELPEKEETVDLPADNIGVKMMKLMGWDRNQGLGKTNQGIKNPIEPYSNRIRAGLGKSTNKDYLRKKFSSLFSQFASSKSEDELVVSTEFPVEERKFLTKLAREYNLKARHRLNLGEKCLVLSNPPKSQSQMWEIVKELLETKNMESEMFRLIQPSSFLNRDLEKTEKHVVECSKTVADKQDNKNTRSKEVKETRTPFMFENPLETIEEKVKEFKSLSCPTDGSQSLHIDECFKPDLCSRSVADSLCPAQESISATSCIKENSLKSDTKQETPFADIVVFNPMDGSCPMTIIVKTCKKNNVQFRNVSTIEDGGKYKHEIFINGHSLSTGVSSVKKEARSLAARRGLEKLLASCYIVEEKCKMLSTGTVITKSTTLSADTSGVDSNDYQDLAQRNANIHRLIKRSLCGDYLNRMFTPVFREYANSKSDKSLIFSTEFTGVERSVLSLLAASFKLVSKSFNDGNEKYLVVSNPNRDIKDIVQELLKSENFETERYRLIHPSLLNM